MITDYFLIQHHPNGGYAAVPCEEGIPAPPATTKHRKFKDADEAYQWAAGHHSKFGAMYSPEVRAETRANFERATRRGR